jgi:hypothetical protein
MLAGATLAVLLAGTGPIAYIREFFFIVYSVQEPMYDNGVPQRSWLLAHSSLCWGLTL